MPGLAKMRTIEDRIPLAKMVKAYEIRGSLRAASALLGIDKKTLAKILRKNGVVVKTRSEAIVEVSAPKRSHEGRVAQWLKDHPRARIPRSNKVLAELVGVSRNAVKCYMYRRRKEMKDILSTLPNLRSIKGRLEDSEGAMWDTALIGSYVFSFDPWKLSVSVSAVMKDGSKKTFTIEDVELFVRALEMRK